MYEVPSIAINTNTIMLTDKDLKLTKKNDLEKIDKLSQSIEVKEIE